MNNPPFVCEWHINSELVQMPPVILEVLRILDSRFSISEEDRDDIRLICNELLYNAVIHGNNSDAGKQVHINLEIDGGEMRISIRDEGSGFNPAGVEKKTKQKSFIHKETGRGMKLVMALADEVVYDANGRLVTFVKKVGPKHG